MDPKLLIPDPGGSAMNPHPMFVHFPVALFPVGLFFLLIARWRESARMVFQQGAGFIPAVSKLDENISEMHGETAKPEAGHVEHDQEN